MVGGLNGSAHRDLTRLQQIIKSRQGAFTPRIGQISFDPLAQRSVPVTLSGAADTGQPSV